MKVEKISEFADKINNVKLLRELIKFLLSKTDEEINMIKETLDKYNYDELLVSIIINTNLKRSIEEIVKIVDTVGKCEDRVIATEIATNWYIHENRPFQEIIDLIKAVDKCKNKGIVLNFVTSKNVERNRTFQEIIEIIEVVNKYKNRSIALNIATHENLEKYRTFQEIIGLIEVVDKCEDKMAAFRIVINKVVQKNNTVQEIIQMIKKKVKTNTKEKLVYTLDNIDTAKELKSYFEKLNVTDVTSKTIVPVYKPTEKD